MLSDIHGNNIALDAILDSVPASRYSQVLVLGDNIGDGPCPDKVLARLGELDTVMIAGNRELLATQHYAGLPETQTALQWQFMRDSLAFMSDRQRSFIKSLDINATCTCGDISVRLVHGSPFSVRELLFYNNTQRLNECLEGIAEQILLCGHNHYQFAHLHNEKLVMNPGSVGLSQKGESFRADYAMLNISGNQFSFELNHTYYDGEKIKREYIDRDLWESSIWGRIAYKEMENGKMYINSFARFVYNLAKSKNANSKPLDDSIWLEACEKWDWQPTDQSYV